MIKNRLLLLAITVFSSVASHASSLTVNVRTHSTLIDDAGGRRSAYAVFTDERLIADVQLDVYKLQQLPSTANGYDALRKLSAATWLDRVRWTLVAEDGSAVELPASRVVTSSVRNRGPQAELARDRDTTVECTTYRATLDFGPFPAGVYTLTATIEGVQSAYRFDVRTGRESRWRDIYLHNKAIHAKTYAEYRQWTLERLQHDPDRLDIVLDLVDRSLEHGTLQETRSYVTRATQIVERRGKQSDTSVTYLREFDRQLPEFFSHRKEWKMVRDTNTGTHVIRSRSTGKVVKELGVRNR